MNADDRQQLNRDCDDLLRGVKTEEDFVREAEEVIDSTTDIEETPPKKRKVDAPAQKKKPGKAKSAVNLAKAEAAKRRAAELFAYSPEEFSHDRLSPMELQRQLLEQTKKIRELEGQLAEKCNYCQVQILCRLLLTQGSAQDDLSGVTI